MDFLLASRGRVSILYAPDGLGALRSIAAHNNKINALNRKGTIEL